MKKSLYISYSFVLALAVLLSVASCVEPIEIELDEPESILVVEGIITDELKQQEIKLSRSFPVDENGPNPVSGAKVIVSSSNGANYTFFESEAGTYLSNSAFQVNLGEDYTLEIETEEGVYESTAAKSETTTQISEVSSEKAVINGEEGVAITVSNTGNSGNGGSYYLFKYQETYEIRSPYEKLYDLIINENDDPDTDRDDFLVVPKPEQDYICYVTEPSSDIILSNTEGLTEDSLNGILIRFISKKEYELAYRYSINVTQLKVSPVAFDYYETLKNLSENESVFSQYQPGFLNGNIRSLDNSNEKVLGYFTTATTDSKRHFFSYTDYFDGNNTRPSHTGDCEEFLPDRELLRELLESEQVKLFEEDPPFVYKVIRRGCVDCTQYGSNQKPEFWID